MDVKELIKGLPKKIDSTLLKPNATTKDIEHLCNEAVLYQFGAVCIRPWDVRYVSKLLKDTGVKVCTVVGFPWGIQTIENKITETNEAIFNGAREIDMVINRGYLKEQNYDMLKREIHDIVVNAKSLMHTNRDVVVKAILEACELTDDEIIKACEIARDAGADYVKTSTGAYKGATAKAVKLMYKTVPNMGIKAAGGIKTFEDALRMLKAGATRIGTSSGVKILKGYHEFLNNQ